MTNFAQPDAYPVEGRGVAYSMAYFSAKHLGEGQFYLMTIVDKDGQALDGGSTYRLTVPPNAPVKLYWSATAYDRATHALIRDLPWSSRASNTPGLTKNADGSVDVYFGPKAPAGKESNWVPTKAGGQFEVLFRLYGPEKPFFDKTWKLPDIEPVSETNKHQTRHENGMHPCRPAIALGAMLTVSAFAQEQAKPADSHGWLGTETVKTRFGDFEFKNGYPTPAAAEALLDQLKFNRAIDVYLTQIPAVAIIETRRGIRDFGAKRSNQVVIWETLMDAKTLVLTANTETVYGMGFLDLKADGATVVEAPPKMLGAAMDMLQRFLVDIGPLGPDKGKGGKYLFLPPGYKGEVPEGYFAVNSPTYSVNYFLRGFKVDGKTDQAVALMKQLKVYPLAKAADRRRWNSSTARGSRSTQSTPTTSRSLSCCPIS